MREIYSEIGQTLKNYRLKRGVTLEKISNKTKISIQNLHNIENGDFHLLAGEFYQRSFIKAYAKALRINDKKMIAKLKDNSSKKEFDKEVEHNKEISKEKNKMAIANEKIPTKPLIFISIFGLVTLFLFNFFTDPGIFGTKLPNIEPKEELQISKIEESIINEIENIKQNDPIKQTNVNVDVDELKNYTELDNFFYKQLIAKEDVWIEIKDDSENILISTILKKDESFNLPNDKKNIIISASNAGALSLKNGDNNSPGLGSFGTVLDSVDLNSLITNH